MSADSPWTLAHRVEAWNLIFAVAHDMFNKVRGVNFSPFVTTAFQYLSAFYNTLDPETEEPIRSDKDLFLITIAATFVTAKAENLTVNLDPMIEFFVAAVHPFTNESKAILGPSSRKLTPGQSSDDWDFAEFHGAVHAAEGYFLSIIQWRFIADYPFSYLNYWMREIRERLPKPQTDEVLGPFRKMRAATIHVLSVFLVALEDGPVDNETLAAASLTAGLRVVHLKGFPADRWHEALGANLGDNVYPLADRVQELERTLRPFHTN
jgi:hypothetical protein